MRHFVTGVLGFISAFGFYTGAIASESPHPGLATYNKYCATCHNDKSNVRVPSLDALQLMSASALRAALMSGVMQEQAKQVPRREVFQLIDYLAARPSASDAWITSIACEAQRLEVKLSDSPALTMVGVDYGSSRQMTASQAGLETSKFAQLELAWAIGFPETNGLRTSPVIDGNTLFYVPDQTGLLLAIDVTQPCVRWVYEAGTPLRSSVTMGYVEGLGKVLVFADRNGQVHNIDAATGKRNWRKEGRHSSGAMITGSPIVYQGQVIVPVSGSGVARAMNPEYECCVEHGSVVALDARTGAQRWTWHTMPHAAYNGEENSKGVKLRGPSGAPIWSSPTVDEKRNLVYVTSGQNTSFPATETSDAVIAIDLASGKSRWVFQALANDVWNMACRFPYSRSGPNCPDEKRSVLKDFDFGAAAVLAKTKDGNDILLAGQKSGDVWAIDPDTGKLVWNTRLGKGSPLGGVHWGMARNDTHVFVPINDPSPAFLAGIAEPGMNAVDISTGKVAWRHALKPDCGNGREQRYENCGTRYGHSAAPLVVDGALIAGTLDGKLMVYDTQNGKLLFSYDALKDFETVNGIKAKGGSIESHSIAAGAGRLFVGAGYGQFGQAPGNVLLAFKPRVAAGATLR